jgi:hypothetical protein
MVEGLCLAHAQDVDAVTDTMALMNATPTP